MSLHERSERPYQVIKAYSLAHSRAGKDTHTHTHSNIQDRKEGTAVVLVGMLLLTVGLCPKNVVHLPRR